MKTKTKTFRKTVLTSLQSRDRTLRQLAEQLRVPIGSLSSMLSNGYLPSDKLAGFSKFTGLARSVVEKELRIIGPYQKMRVVRMQSPRGTREQDMLPFLRRVLRIGLKAITKAELSHLWRWHLGNEDTALTAAVVKKVLKERGKQA